MRRLLWVGMVGTTVVVATSAGWAFFRSNAALRPAAAAHLESTSRVPASPVADVATTSAPAKTETAWEAPRAVTDETDCSLGTLEPGESCEHTFLIRNEGSAALKLDRGGTSCKCTMSDLPSGDVPPGSAVQVRVSSKIEPKEGPFNHRATILTNDPDRPQIDFRLRGRVRTMLTVSQSRIGTYTLADETPEPMDVTIYSLAWSEFSITDVKASMPDATWDVQPEDPEVLNRLDAKSGYRMAVRMPPQQDTGFHTLHLDVTAYPDGQPEAEHKTHVIFTHEVRGGGEISGPNYQGFTKTLDLGPLSEGEGKSDHVVVVIRDKQRRPNIVKVESEPAFLRVVAEPLEGGREGTHLFRLGVEVPDDAPPCNYRTTKGWVRVTMDSKALKTGSFQFNVSFAISSRR